MSPLRVQTWGAWDICVQNKGMRVHLGSRRSDGDGFLYFSEPFGWRVDNQTSSVRPETLLKTELAGL